MVKLAKAVDMDHQTTEELKRELEQTRNAQQVKDLVLVAHTQAVVLLAEAAAGMEVEHQTTVDVIQEEQVVQVLFTIHQPHQTIQVVADLTVRSIWQTLKLCQVKKKFQIHEIHQPRKDTVVMAMQELHFNNVFMYIKFIFIYKSRIY